MDDLQDRGRAHQVAAGRAHRLYRRRAGPDVTEHPAFRNAVHSAASLYDFQAAPENLELMTFALDGANRRVNQAWQMPRTYEEMVAAARAHGLGRAELRLHGSFARSRGVGAGRPAHGYRRVCPHGTARAKAFVEYFDYASRADLFLTYVIINPQADRSKDAGDQDEDLVARIVDEDSSGLTIRGAKMLGTSSIMANEVFVANLQPLKPGEEDLAFCCALPMKAKGLRVLSRKSYEDSAVSVFDNPMSSRFDENDALIYFDDVKVPWDRVFVHRDVDLCRAQFHDTPGHIYQNYQAQIRLVIKLKFLVGLARRLTETIGTSNMPQVREHFGQLAANAGMVEAMLHGMEAAGEQSGEWWVPNGHHLYAAQTVTQDLYPKMINAIRELAGGAFIMLPSSYKDWANPGSSRSFARRSAPRRSIRSRR